VHLKRALRRGSARCGHGVMRPAGLVAVLLVLSSGPASAQGYPPSSDTLAVSTSTAVPGQPITISGSGYEPGTTVTITFESTPRVIGVVQADASGRFTAEVVVPPDATPGMHTIRATGMGDDGTTRVVSASILVRPPAAAGAEGPPPGRPSARGAANAADAGTGAAADAASQQSGNQGPAGAAPTPRRASRLSLTGPVGLSLLVVTALGAVVLGTLLTRVRRRRPLL